MCGAILSRPRCPTVPASVALCWPTNPAASLGRKDRSSMPDEHLTSCSPKCANVWLRCSESTELLVHLLPPLEAASSRFASYGYKPERGQAATGLHKQARSHKEHCRKKAANICSHKSPRVVKKFERWTNL